MQQLRKHCSLRILTQIRGSIDNSKREQQANFGKHRHVIVE